MSRQVFGNGALAAGGDAKLPRLWPVVELTVMMAFGGTVSVTLPLTTLTFGCCSKERVWSVTHTDSDVCDARPPPRLTSRLCVSLAAVLGSLLAVQWSHAETGHVPGQQHASAQIDCASNILLPAIPVSMMMLTASPAGLTIVR